MPIGEKALDPEIERQIEEADGDQEAEVANETRRRRPGGAVGWTF